MVTNAPEADYKLVIKPGYELKYTRIKVTGRLRNLCASYF
ncbi:hypothetical protein EG68_05491 [Paragonimus skrjabini miyazakii]|uniref:Uncharacterized protein n=1 Tax=Paragonimus skrjabini miyazakii TaxID=59628 RepID=A0A8S9YRP2_9TREM|nr:hypothetical protein EG68_05491 [Paragonimus skrjabini miyazakii]